MDNSTGPGSDWQEKLWSLQKRKCLEEWLDEWALRDLKRIKDEGQEGWEDHPPRTLR